jgi:hypothetical protein
MSHVEASDALARGKAKQGLKEAGMFVHCPADSEAKDRSLYMCQEADFQFMRAATGHLVVWPVPYGKLSIGSLAEIEWARRVYHIPSVIWVPVDYAQSNGFPMSHPDVVNQVVPEWCRVSSSAFGSLQTAIEDLRSRLE